VSLRLPIFPLATVLYPGLVLPLQVFEDRYLQLVRDLENLPAEQRRFGVVALRHGKEVGQPCDSSSLHEFGCVANVREIELVDDGRVALVTSGGPRFRLGPLDHTRAYLRAEVELLDEPAGSGEALGEAATVARLFAEYRLALTGSPGELDFVDDPELVSYVVAAAAVLDLAEKQALLEAPTTSRRLKLEVGLLRREIGILRMLPSLPAMELPATEVSKN
jgi:hypothetical protein